MTAIPNDTPRPSRLLRALVERVKGDKRLKLPMFGEAGIEFYYGAERIERVVPESFRAKLDVDVDAGDAWTVAGSKPVSFMHFRSFVLLVEGQGRTVDTTEAPTQLDHDEAVSEAVDAVMCAILVHGNSLGMPLRSGSITSRRLGPEDKDKAPIQVGSRFEVKFQLGRGVLDPAARPMVQDRSAKVGVSGVAGSTTEIGCGDG